MQFEVYVSEQLQSYGENGTERNGSRQATTETASLVMLWRSVDD